MIDFTVIQQAFSGIFAQAITFIPRLLTTIIILLIGWFISRFLSTLIKRIAERVDALLRLCDDLSAHITAAQATRAALRDAALAM